VACDALSQLTIGGQGRAVFTAGDQRIDAVAGDILVVPPDTPHTFANAGASVLKMGIHASERFVTIWLDG
jgi:quercetin dioxygenase-like cupin family protein